MVEGLRASYGRKEVSSELYASLGRPLLCDLRGLAGPFMAKQDVADSVGADGDIEPFRSRHHSLVELHARSIVE